MFGSGSSDITSRINVIPGDTSGLRVYDRAQREIDDLRRSTVSATGAADKLGNSLAKAARGADFGRTGGGLERVLGGTLGGGSQELLGIVGDIGDVVEGLAAEPGGLKGALKGLITPAGLLSVGLAAGGIAMAAFTAEIERQRAAAQASIQELVAAAQSQESYMQLLKSSGAAAIENAALQQQAQFDIQQASFYALGARRAELVAITDAQRARGTFLTQEQTELDLLNAEYAKNASAIEKAQNNLNILNEIMNGTEFAAKKASEAFADNLKAIADSDKKTSDAMAARLERMAGVLDKTAATADAAAEAFTDLQTSVQSAVDKLDADGSKLGADLQKSIAALNNRMVEANQDAAAEIAEVQIDAARSRLEAESEYYKETNRAFEDFRTEQRRIGQDADRAAKEAIESNSIDQLLNIREQEQVDKERNRERFETERQRRQEDFADRRAAEEAALAATIAGIIQQRDEEIASINAEIMAERAAFDTAIALINAQKDAQIAQIDAVIAANERKHTAELSAIDTATRRWEALVLYQNGQLYQINPALKSSPATAGSALSVPPPPVDPFGLGDFFNGRSLPPAREGGQSYNPLAVPPSVSITLPPGAVVVGDLASKADVFQSVYDAIRAAAAALYQARTGVAA